MEKIFYTSVNAYPNSETAVLHVFKHFFDMDNMKLIRNENGKPFLSESNRKLFFSVSHTNDVLFIAVSDENVGIDAESETRNVQYGNIVKKFSTDEKKEISTSLDFLIHWTAKESTIKWLGGKILHDLNKLTYAHNQMQYQNIPLPIRITFPPFKNYVIAVCSETDFSNAEYIPF